jgi:hypothetical protein
MPNSDDPQLHCRVCGFQLLDPPWGEDGCTPTFEYCPCCGVEFGYQDSTPSSTRRYRKQWITRGMPWDLEDAKPDQWDSASQLKHIPIDFL